MLLHGLAEFAGVEKQQAQNTLENVYGCTGWKDAHNKENLFYISQTPVSSSFCEHILLSTVPLVLFLVLTEINGTGFGFYSSCLFLSIVLRNYTETILASTTW